MGVRGVPESLRAAFVAEFLPRPSINKNTATTSGWRHTPSPGPRNIGFLCYVVCHVTIAPSM